jgi:hypothetical protein
MTTLVHITILLLLSEQNASSHSTGMNTQSGKETGSRAYIVRYKSICRASEYQTPVLLTRGLYPGFKDPERITF